MSHEFEDHQLGELPEDIIGYLERDELKSYTKDIGSSRQGGIPADIQQLDNIQGIEGETASPGIPASVTSVYDARPINARDFLNTTVEQLIHNRPTGTPPVLEVTTEFEIPQSLTGVLRGFSYAPDIVVDFAIATLQNAAITFIPAQATLLINELRIPNYVNMDLGQSVEPFLPCFALANAGSVFKLRVLYDTDVVAAMTGLAVLNSTVNVRMQLYGNLLLSRGLPANFEVATQQYSGRRK